MSHDTNTAEKKRDNCDTITRRPQQLILAIKISFMVEFYFSFPLLYGTIFPLLFRVMIQSLILPRLGPLNLYRYHSNSPKLKLQV